MRYHYLFFLWVGWLTVGMVSCHPYQPQLPQKLPPTRLQTHPSQFGMPRWIFPPTGLRFLENIISAPVVGQQHVYVLTSDSQIYAIDFSGSVSWTWQPKRVQTTGDRILAQPVLAPNGQMLLVGTQQHYLYAVTNDGKEKWAEPCWLPGPILMAPRITAQRIYISTPGHLKAFDLQGQPVWSYRLPTSSRVYTAVEHSDGSVFITESGGHIHRISPHPLGPLSNTTPTTEQTTGLSTSLPTSTSKPANPANPARATNTSQTAQLSNDPCLYLTAHGTTPVPTMYCPYKKLCDQISTAPTMDQTGQIYVGCNNGQMYVLRSDMSQAWTATTAGPILTQPTVSRDDQTVYVGSNDMNLYAYKTTDGSLLWKFRSGRYSSDKQGGYTAEPAAESVMYIKAPVSVDHIGRVYVGSINHWAHAISSQGKLLWQYELDGWVEYPPAFFLDPETNRGTLFLATARRLFAFNF